MVKVQKPVVKCRPAKQVRGKRAAVREGRRTRAEDETETKFDEPATPAQKPVVPVETPPAPAANEDALDSGAMQGRSPPSSSDLN